MKRFLIIPPVLAMTLCACGNAGPEEIGPAFERHTETQEDRTLTITRAADGSIEAVIWVDAEEHSRVEVSADGEGLLYVDAQSARIALPAAEPLPDLAQRIWVVTSMAQADLASTAEGGDRAAPETGDTPYFPVCGSSSSCDAVCCGETSWCVDGNVSCVGYVACCAVANGSLCFSEYYC